MLQCRRRALLATAVCCCVPRLLTAQTTELQLDEVAPGVFVHHGLHEDFTPENAGAIANISVIVGERAVAVVDSGGSLREGDALLQAIRAVTDLPIAYVVNTHVHPDHLLGNVAFAGSGAVVVGHAKLPERLAEAGPYYLDNMRRLLGESFAGTELVRATLTVADRQELDLGDRRLLLRAWPTAHTNTDLTVFDETTGTLLTGDLLFIGRIPVVDGSLLGWLHVMDELERLPAERVVPGHGPVSAPWPASSAPQRRYLEYLRDSVRDELKRNRTLEQAVDEVPMPPGDVWALAADNHARNVTASFTELEWE